MEIHCCNCEKLFDEKHGDFDERMCEDCLNQIENEEDEDESTERLAIK